MNLFSAAALLVLPALTAGQSCSFSRDFGNGNALSTSSVESFNVAAGATTTCIMTCDSGAATTLWLKYDEAPTIFDSDATSFDADGCTATISLSSGSAEYRLGYQVNTATYNNLVLACTCTSVGPVEEPSSVCFSETATVTTKDHGVAAMKDLQVGEHVLVGHYGSKPLYEPVYSFGHRHETQKATFVQLYTNLTADNPLEISPSHLLYKHGGEQAVRADSIQIFDVLVSHNHAAAKVTRIEYVTKPGLYMPLTPSGTIIVNGVKASTYVSIQEWAPFVVQALSPILSEQTVSHWWLAPYRFFCLGLSKGFCERGRNEEGILNYLIQGKQLAEWAEDGVVTRVLMVGPPLLVFFGLLNLLEYPLGPSMAPILLAAVLGMVWYYTRNTNKTTNHHPTMAKKTV